MGIADYIKEAGQTAKQEMIGRSGGLRGDMDSFADAENSMSSTSLMRALIGPVGDIGDFYFPSDLIGGVCPRVPGKEEFIVWNAAVEACDTERVHVVWQAVGNCIWYLAVKSSDLSSHTNSWCPLASLLPTEKDIAHLPVCYTYFGEDVATLMAVTGDSLRVFRGTAAVIRAKAERVAHEYGENVKVVNIDLFQIGQMTPMPWYSVFLFEDRARRILATVSVVTALFVLALSFLVWLVSSMATVSAHHDLTAAKERSQAKAQKLLHDAENMRSSHLREQLDKFLFVNDGLLPLNGFLTVYEIKDNSTRWKAVVPPSATADRISAIGGKSMETTDKGVAIGNDAQIEFESRQTGRR